MLTNSARALIKKATDEHIMFDAGQRLTVEEVRSRIVLLYHKTIGHSGTRAALERLCEDGLLISSYQWKRGQLVRHYELSSNRPNDMTEGELAKAWEPKP